MHLIHSSSRPVPPANDGNRQLAKPFLADRQYPESVMRPKILQDAVEGLYAVFSAYPLDPDTSPCLCCHLPEANERLQAAPLRHLTWQHLADFTRDALVVWGNLDDFKHFLPRIFDLVLRNSNQDKQAPFPQAVFKKLKDAEWRRWPQPEQAAIEVMLHAVWETVRANCPQAGYIDVDEWIGAIAQCEDDLTPYLNQWLADDRLSAAWALSSLVLGSPIAYTGPFQGRPVWTGEESRETIQKWFRRPHPNAYWQERGDQYTQLQQWATSDLALDKLHRAEAACPDGEIRHELATAQRCIKIASLDNWQPVYQKRLFQSAHWQSAPGRLY